MSAAKQFWEQVFETLGLIGDKFEDNLSALDRFLDSIEEKLDVWGTAQGVGAYE